MLSQCCNASTTELSDEFDSEEMIGNTNLVVCDECKNFTPKVKTEESLEKICKDFFDAYDSVRYTREVGVMNRCFIEVCERFLKTMQKHQDLLSLVDKFCNTPSPL